MINEFISDLTTQYLQGPNFIMILIFLLIMIITYSILEISDLFKQNKPAALIISISIAFLALFFTKETEIVNAYLIPYKLIGLVIIYFLPFIIMLFVIYKAKMSSVGRRMILGVFTAIEALWLFNPTNTISVGNTYRIALIGIPIVIILLDNVIYSIIKNLKN